jgi:ABC-2 type transport system ATP-binding protein
MAKKAILDVKNLKKSYGSYQAVDDISFNVKEGEIVGLLGPNGAGKTTTINMLLGVLTPTSGKIEYFNKDFKTHREEILKQINFCSSYVKLPYRLTAYENLDVIARLYEVKNRKKRIEKMLEIFEMLESKNRPISSFSAGQTMRVMLAKAFLNYPKLILLDEPTASLDPDVAQKVRDFLLKEQKEFGVSMLLTSHNMAEVEQLADRVIFLNKGKILAEDTPEGLASKIDTSRVELLIRKNLDGAQQKIAEFGWESGISGRYLKIELKEGDIARLLYALSGAGVEYDEISIEKPDLEDFFISVSKGVQEEEEKKGQDELQ